MRTPDDPAFALALHEAALRVQDLHSELHAAYPVLQESLAVPGIFIGHGLGFFVARGLTTDQILTSVRTLVAEIRQLPQPQPS